MKLRVEKFFVVKACLVAVTGAATFGVCRFWLTSTEANAVLDVAGYWTVLASFSVFVGFALRGFARKSAQSWRRALSTHWPGLLGVVVIGSLWHVHEPHRLKILYDEAGYSGIAYNMHTMREASFPARAHFLDGRLRVLESVTDKRPFFFSFLVSLTHDLTGYRFENVFWVNAVIGFCLLCLAYGLGASLWNRSAGLVILGFLGGLPLLAQCVTSGGYEVLNAALIVGSAVAGLKYTRSAGTRWLNLLTSCVLLLAQVRYESILFVLVVPLIVAAKAWHTGVLRITWFSVVAPAFLAIPLLVNRVFLALPQYWQTAPGQAFFSIEYLTEFLPEAVFYLLNPAWTATNSVVLSTLGICACVVAIVRLPSALRFIQRRRVVAVLLPFFVLILLNATIALSSFWGNWNDPLVSRFSLPLQLGFSFAIAPIVAGLRARPRRICVGMAFAQAFAFGIPPQAQADATAEMVSSSELVWLRKQLEGFEPERTLVISVSPIATILWRYPSLGTNVAAVSQWKLAHLMEREYYSDILVVQRLRTGFVTGQSEVGAGYRIDGVDLEVVAEFRPRLDTISRLCRIRGIADDFARMPPSVVGQIDHAHSDVEKSRIQLELLP